MAVSFLSNIASSIKVSMLSEYTHLIFDDKMKMIIKKLIIHDGGSQELKLSFVPWCGVNT